MKHTSTDKTTVHTTTDSVHSQPSAGPNGVAMAPPSYGMDVADNAPAKATLVQDQERLSPAAHGAIQMKAGASAAGSDAGERPANRTGMPDTLKAGIETLSGLALDDVRVHYNSAQPAQLQALAYTQGAEIHVGPGQERHLPHEAWHVVQQKQGRVRPTLQMKGATINDDDGLEREADVMGAQAAQNKLRPTAETYQTSSVPSRNIIQRRLGFEIEMLVLVDINGRPIPEKVNLGTAGAHNVELTVDHGPAVEAQTPTSAHVGNMAFTDNRPGRPNNLVTLGRYDLDTAVGGGALHAPHQASMRYYNPTGLAVPADPRTTMPPLNNLHPPTWAANTAGNRYTRPGGVIATPFNNAHLATLDALIGQYRYEVNNWESGRTTLLLQGISASIQGWVAANPKPSRLHPYNRHLWTGVRNLLNSLNNDAIAHRAWWIAQPTAPQAVPAAPGVAAVPGMRRHYQPTGGGGPWTIDHPVESGMGADTYASILEIVTPGGAGYEPETLAGRANIIGAMTDAVNLAIAIEAATGNFANRVLLNTVAGVHHVTNPATYVGNPLQPNQTTGASIQATMAVDLAQIASFIKSTVAAAMNPQQLYALKHHSDPQGAMGLPVPRRSETEMARAPLAAKNIIRNHLAHLPGWNANVTHLRGLITLICQYLMMGRHFEHGGAGGLDKNIVPLLSRNNLGSVLFNELVPPAEQALITPANLPAVVAAILAETGRNGAMAVFNRAADDYLPAAPAPFDVSCTQFITNVLTGHDDGITGNLGGFRQFPHTEGVDPLGARPGDYRRGAAAQREGAIFEMRNIVPSDALNLATDRFPHNQWIILATYLCNLLDALNNRTVLQSATDTRYRQATGLLQNEIAPW
jgi:hypothetical protein